MADPYAAQEAALKAQRAKRKLQEANSGAKAAAAVKAQEKTLSTKKPVLNTTAKKGKASLQKTKPGPQSPVFSQASKNKIDKAEEQAGGY